MRRRAAVLWALAALVAAAAAWVRLAPADPGRWHVDPAAADLPADCTVQSGNASARLSCLLSDPPAAALARLAAVAEATPRTRRLAGSPEAGRITWETRSRLWGFPDYTTAAATSLGDGTTRLDILARSRFGANDWGVNAARLDRWRNALAP